MAYINLNGKRFKISEEVFKALLKWSKENGDNSIHTGMIAANSKTLHYNVSDNPSSLFYKKIRRSRTKKADKLAHEQAHQIQVDGKAAD